MNMQALLKQAQKMQKDIAETENELKGRTYESEISGGAVKAIASGEMVITEIMINDDDLLSVDNKDMLQDMVMMAVNEALKKASEDKEKVMNKLTAGVKLPGGL